MLALSRYGLPKPWTPRRSDLCARRCSPPWAIGDADAAMDGQVDWLIAPDAFKGTLSAREVALALARGTRDGGGEIEICPVADGGEGTLEILLRALGGRRVQTRVHDPMGRPLDASFGGVQGQSRAIVSSADGRGLGGAPEVVVALGGSASPDGGAGAIEGIESRGGLGGARLTVLADVSTPFERAAEVFAPQKGADAAAVERLSRRLQEQAAGLPRDPRGVAMTGAAGGLAGGLWAMYGARLVPGAPSIG